MNWKNILKICCFIVGITIFSLNFANNNFDYGALINILIYVIGVSAGFYILIFGGDKLVSGAGSIASKYNIPTIIIGLVILSLGSSAPEFFINVLAAVEGQTELLISNIIGSNISNLLLILGISSIIYSLGVKDSTLYKEIPFSLLAVIALLVLVNDTFISGMDTDILHREESIILLLFFCIFMYYVYTISQNGKEESTEGIKEYTTLKSVGFLFFGVIGLYIGGELVVNNSVKLAKTIGISDTLIGVTIVAVGTSLPELAASVSAALKKQADMIIGNVIGSNIFNIFWILGVSGLITPIEFDKKLNTDLFLLIIATLIVFISVYTGRGTKIGRYEGIILVAIYALYIGYAIIRG